ncbi:multicopper oxidase domain-containing protein [Fundidesulfovibrio agrisoli]|uniref:multicopper oxidase domain-containing protein n=1 Tax=Fundidesulfovibrio agrisoli TaxID=2922717 RepID=UPI001FAE42C5|nr:multicopper oxidase domain-containing protein [Fundidesulfovibrio agrisoli]
MGKTTTEQRRAAALEKARQQASTPSAAALATGAKSAAAPAAVVPQPLGQADLFGAYPNWSWSPLPEFTQGNFAGTYVPGTGIKKFVNQLPTLFAATTDGMNKKLAMGVPDTITYPGTDYYEISLEEVNYTFHQDLPPTKLRSYRQTNNGTNSQTGQNTVAPPAYSYGGPIIVAQKDRPVRVKLTNNLPVTASGGNLFIPTDTTMMGAGMGPNGVNSYPQNRGELHLHGGMNPWISDGTPHQWTAPAAEPGPYTWGASAQNVPDMPPPGGGSITYYYTNQQSARLMFYHDHALGITRLNVYVGEAAGYVVRDGTEFALENAGIIPPLTDNIPLIIQDRTFVDSAQSKPVYSIAAISGGSGYSGPVVTVTDSGGSGSGASVGVTVVGGVITGLTINSGGSNYVSPVVNISGGGGAGATATATATFGAITSLSVTAGGSGYASPTVAIAAPTSGTTATAAATVTSGVITGLRLTNKGSGYTFPPAVTITDTTGSGAAAYAFVNTILATDPTWSTATWGTTGGLWYPHVYMPNQTGSAVGLGANAMGRWDYALWFWPPYTGILAHGAVPNPYFDPVNAPWEPAQIPGIPNPSTTPEAFHDTPIVNGVAYPYMNVEPRAYRFRILNACNDRMLNLQLYKADPAVTTVDNRTNTEVKMIPVPQGQSIYGKPSGIPDPTMKGPDMIQIGNEGGFLPAPVVLTNTPIGFETNPKNIVVGNVLEKNLFMGPAERADVIIDFSAFAGQTVILYQDSPAPVPAFETRVDYYTGNPDQTAVGGSPSTIAGFGPNTRTIMQFRVGAQASPGSYTTFNLGNLQNAFKSTAQALGVFAASQHPPLVPQAEYGSAYNTTFPSTNVVPIQANSLTFTPLGALAPLTINFTPKAIQELFETNYGRLNALLGVELPFTNGTNQTTIPIGYAEPTPDSYVDSVNFGVPTAGDGTQIWKITHNGVDTHPVHFHLYDVQVLNRVGWDGAIRLADPNELGWKETVRMNPLEDCIVALRPVAPKLPFGVPKSNRLIDPTQPQGAPISTIDPLTNAAVTVPNNPTDYDWEYVWHCHILSHEENDMMHAAILHVTTTLPAKPILTTTKASNGMQLKWTDGTRPVISDLTTLGNPANEIGFKIMRATVAGNGSAGAYSQVATALANQTSYLDTTASANTTYKYKIIAYNASGESVSINGPVFAPEYLLLLLNN